MSGRDPATAELRRRLRPAFGVFVASLVGLLINGLLATFAPYGHVWIIEVLIATVMVALVIVISMDSYKEPPLIALFSGLGFFWVAILFGLTMMDYLNR